MPPQQGRVLSTDPNAGVPLSTDPNAGETISTDLNTILSKPKSARGDSVVFPKTWGEAGASLGNTAADLGIGAAKGTGRMLIDLAKMQFDPSGTFRPPLFDVATRAMKPEGPTQTLGSFAPDVLLGLGTAKAAGRTAAEFAAGPAYEQRAGRIWDAASDRPLAEISGNPGFSREVLKRGFGPLTQRNAVNVAEYRASRLPGTIDTRTPAVPEVKPVTLYDESGKAMQVGGQEGKAGSGFFAQPTKPRNEAFGVTQASYNQANRHPHVIGVPIPQGLTSERIKARYAQELFDNADLLQKVIPGGSAGVASALARLMTNHRDDK